MNFPRPSNTLEVREQESSSEGQASSEQGEDEKENASFADFNLCGPSLSATKRCQSGYTTESGMIKPHLQSLHSLCQHPKADLHAIVDTKKVCTISVALASDSTALTAGLEYDSGQKQAIGLTQKVDEKFVKKHPFPDPEKIKTNLITSADVTFATSLDNGDARDGLFQTEIRDWRNIFLHERWH